MGQHFNYFLIYYWLKDDNVLYSFPFKTPAENPKKAAQSSLGPNEEYAGFLPLTESEFEEYTKKKA